MFSEKCLKLSDLPCTPRFTVLLCDLRQVPSPLWSSVGGFGLIFASRSRSWQVPRPLAVGWLPYTMPKATPWC